MGNYSGSWQMTYEGSEALVRELKRLIGMLESGEATFVAAEGMAYLALGTDTDTIQTRNVNLDTGDRSLSIIYQMPGLRQVDPATAPHPSTLRADIEAGAVEVGLVALPNVDGIGRELSEAERATLDALNERRAGRIYALMAETAIDPSDVGALTALEGHPDVKAIDREIRAVLTRQSQETHDGPDTLDLPAESDGGRDRRRVRRGGGPTGDPHRRARRGG